MAWGAGVAAVLSALGALACSNQADASAERADVLSRAEQMSVQQVAAAASGRVGSGEVVALRGSVAAAPGSQAVEVPQMAHAQAPARRAVAMEKVVRVFSDKVEIIPPPAPPPRPAGGRHRHGRDPGDPEPPEPPQRDRHGRPVSRSAPGGAGDTSSREGRQPQLRRSEVSEVVLQETTPTVAWGLADSTGFVEVDTATMPPPPLPEESTIRRPLDFEQEGLYPRGLFPPYRRRDSPELRDTRLEALLRFLPVGFTVTVVGYPRLDPYGNVKIHGVGPGALAQISTQELPSLVQGHITSSRVWRGMSWVLGVGAVVAAGAAAWFWFQPLTARRGGGGGGDGDDGDDSDDGGGGTRAGAGGSSPGWHPPPWTSGGGGDDGEDGGSGGGGDDRDEDPKEKLPGFATAKSPEARGEDGDDEDDEDEDGDGDGDEDGDPRP